MAAPRPTLVGFRVKYWTEWGQNLVVVGNHPKLGEWDVRKGVWMHCQVRARGHPSRSTADGMRSLLSANPNYLSPPRRTRGFPPLRLPARRRPRARHLRCPRRFPTHRFPSPSPSLPVMAQHVSDDELLWTGHVTGVFPGSFEYRYAVVDSDMNVVRWDAFAHTASFGGSHARLRGKEDRSPDRVEMYDTWEFQSHPENLFRRSTFRDVVVPSGTGDGLPGDESTTDSNLTHIETGADALESRVAALALEAAGGRVRLRLECRTFRLLRGHHLHATGSCAALGRWDRERSLPMNFDHETRTWHVDLDVALEELPVRYKYALRGGDHDVLETGTDRSIAPLGWTGSTRPSPERTPSASELASEGTSPDADADANGDSDRGRGRGRGPGDAGVGVTRASSSDRDFFAPIDPSHVRLAQVEESPASSPAGSPPRRDAASIASASAPRRPNGATAPSRLVARDGHFRFPGEWRGCGVAVPVFSLRSRESLGAGDFGDLRSLVDVAAAAGMNVVQILPVNDTTVHNTWWDSYPYSSVSVFALHPLYLRVQPLVEEAAAAAGPEGSGRFAALRAEVDKAKFALDLKEVDYEATMKVKLSVARRCFDEVRATFLASEEFRAFLDDAGGWLAPYAVFSALRDVFGTAQHWRWGALSAENAAETVARLSQPGSEIYSTVALHYYLQYHLDAQLRAAAARAAERGVILKGDLPIGVDKASVDTWMYPDLFRMNTSTGAPPDDFDPNGQNWGFPTYNWDNMSKDGYAWWRARMTRLERYFSAMRVDHVLGFFRIWELPAHARVGRMGRFRPSVPIRRHELDARGLWFIDRLCEPHITAATLRDVFGEREGEVAGRFLQETGACASPDGGATTTYRFKPEFATEESLLGSDAFRVREGSPDWLVAETESMLRGLLRLQHNVCLLRDPEDPDAFYPRIEMEKTTSFAELEEWARHALSWLHDDYFHHRQDNLWRENARRTLPALTGCTGQLVCGEDLGMVPSCVPPVLEELGILGLRIQRMPHEPGEFGRPERYPYDTVCSPSCHDTTTTRAWYEADAARRARFAKIVLGMIGDGGLESDFPPPPAYRAEHVEAGSGARRRTSVGSVGSADYSAYATEGDGEDPTRATRGVAPPSRCEPRVMRAVVRQHMASPSALAVFPAQDLLALAAEYAQRPAEEETINDPTNPRHYWRFRLHVRLEDLAANRAWLAEIRQLAEEAGRNPGAGGIA